MPGTIRLRSISTPGPAAQHQQADFLPAAPRLRCTRTSQGAVSEPLPVCTRHRPAPTGLPRGYTAPIRPVASAAHAVLSVTTRARATVAVGRPQSSVPRMPQVRRAVLEGPGPPIRSTPPPTARNRAHLAHYLALMNSHTEIGNAKEAHFFFSPGPQLAYFYAKQRREGGREGRGEGALPPLTRGRESTVSMHFMPGNVEP